MNAVGGDATLTQKQIDRLMYDPSSTFGIFKIGFKIDSPSQWWWRLKLNARKAQKDVGVRYEVADTGKPRVSALSTIAKSFAPLTFNALCPAATEDAAFGYRSYKLHPQLQCSNEGGHYLVTSDAASTLPDEKRYPKAWPEHGSQRCASCAVIEQDVRADAHIGHLAGLAGGIVLLSTPTGPQMGEIECAEVERPPLSLTGNALNFRASHKAVFDHDSSWRDANPLAGRQDSDQLFFFNMEDAGCATPMNQLELENAGMNVGDPLQKPCTGPLCPCGRCTGNKVVPFPRYWRRSETTGAAYSDNGVDDLSIRAFDKNADGDNVKTSGWVNAYDMFSVRKGEDIYVPRPVTFHRCQAGKTKCSTGGCGDACLGGDRPIDQQCAPGYSGFLCADCQTGYYKNNFTCEACSGGAGSGEQYILLGAMAVGLVLFSLFMIAKANNSVKEPTAADVLKAGATDTERITMSIKILLAFMQVQSMAGEIKAAWPQEIANVQSAQASVSTPNGFIGQFKCIMAGESEGFAFVKVTAVCILPFFAILVPGLWYGLRYALGGVPSEAGVTWKDRFISSTVVLLFFLHPTVAKEVFILLACTTLEKGPTVAEALADPTLGLSGLSVLNANNAVQCYDATHNFYLLFVGVPSLIVWVCGIPLGAYLIMKTYATQTEEHPDGRLEEMAVQRQFAFLYNGYEPEYYYWELIITARKISMAFVQVAVASFGGIIQVICVLFIIQFALLLNIKSQPYLYDEQDKLETISLTISWATLMSGITFKELSSFLGQAAFETSMITKGIVLIVGVINLYVFFQIFEMVWKSFTGIRKAKKVKAAAQDKAKLADAALAKMAHVTPEQLEKQRKEREKAAKKAAKKGEAEKLNTEDEEDEYDLAHFTEWFLGPEAQDSGLADILKSKTLKCGLPRVGTIVDNAPTIQQIFDFIDSPDDGGDGKGGGGLSREELITALKPDNELPVSEQFDLAMKAFDVGKTYVSEFKQHLNALKASTAFYQPDTGIEVSIFDEDIREAEDGITRLDNQLRARFKRGQRVLGTKDHASDGTAAAHQGEAWESMVKKELWLKKRASITGAEGAEGDERADDQHTSIAKFAGKFAVAAAVATAVAGGAAESLPDVEMGDRALGADEERP